MHKSDWDDLRFVLAVAEEGSLNAAARRLGVNHATVLRRVAAFEALHGAAIFLRSARGYAVRPEKMALIGAVQDAAAAMQRVETMGDARTEPALTPVRLTSTDSFCVHVLPKIVPDLLRQGVFVELGVSNDRVDLGRLRAEITVRPAMELPADLTGTSPADLGFAVFRAVGQEELGWLGLTGPLARSKPAIWMTETGVSDHLVGGADSFVALREMVAAGMGQAILPAFLGTDDPRIERVDTSMPAMSVPIWVASHSEHADLPRLVRIRKVLSEALAARSGWLAGLEGRS